MIDKLLNKFGYYKFELPKGSRVSESDIMEIMGTVGDIDGFPKLLRDLAENDKDLYFQAVGDRDRHVVRGGRDRTMYFLSLIQRAHAKRKRN